MSNTTTPAPPGTPGTGSTASRSGFHPVNIGHLVMGIAFLGIVGIWTLIAGEVVTGTRIRWLIPVPWVLAGLVGLAAISISSSRRWSGTKQVGWVGSDDTAGSATDAAPDDGPDLDPDSDPDLDPDLDPDTTTTEERA